MRLVLSLLAIMALIPGCRIKQPAEKLQVKLLVMDFDISDEVASQPKELKGWWSGSRDIYRNANAGEIFADVLVKQFDKKIPHVLVYSRTDWKYYAADKKNRLKKTFSDQNDNAIAQLFSAIPATDFAKDLQQDLVLFGKIKMCHTSHNRTFHWWSSIIDVEAILMDADSGKALWTKNLRFRKKFHSQYSTMEKASNRLIKLMKKEYFDK